MYKCENRKNWKNSLQNVVTSTVIHASATYLFNNNTRIVLKKDTDKLSLYKNN